LCGKRSRKDETFEREREEREKKLKLILNLSPDSTLPELQIATTLI